MGKGEALSVWQTHSFRITGFVSPTGVVGNPIQWWESVIGSPPEKEMNVRARSEMHFEGSFEGTWTTLRILPGRIDWSVAIHPEEQSNSPVLLTLGSFSDILESHINVISERWFNLESYPLMQRLAFGVELVTPVENREAGYDVINQLLPSVELSTKDTSDFLYQINRRRSSKVVDELEINRLSRWSINLYKSARFSLGADLSSQAIIAGDATFYAAVTMDINTVVDYGGDFDKDKSNTIFRELLELAQEIAVEGDVP